MKKILFALLFLLFVAPVLAQVPNYSDKYINDFANVLNVTQQSSLRELFSSIDQSTTAEMTLLTVDTVAPMAMSQYAQEVFDKWKIGKADKDNGLLILYAKQENKIWVQTGYGLEGILPDSKIGRILDEIYISERDANNTAQGIILAARTYADVISENAEEVRSGNAGASSDDSYLVIYLIFFILIFVGPLFASIKPKCPICKGKTEIIKTEYAREGGLFGREYTIRTYRCKKCNHIFQKKIRRNRGGILFIGGGHRGGFGGGGFGGGGSGGGGAGR